MKNYIYVSIIVLLSGSIVMQAMEKQKKTEKELLGLALLEAIDSQSCVIKDEIAGSWDDDSEEEEFDNALLQSKHLRSAQKGRALSAFPLRRSSPTREIEGPGLESFADKSNQEVVSVGKFMFAAGAPVLNFRHPDFLLRHAEVDALAAPAQATSGHHRTVSLSSEAYDSAGLPIPTSRKISLTVLQTIDESSSSDDDGDSLSRLVASLNFKQKSARK